MRKLWTYLATGENLQNKGLNVETKQNRARIEFFFLKNRKYFLDLKGAGNDNVNYR